jgi:hypothetical protein
LGKKPENLTGRKFGLLTVIRKKHRFRNLYGKRVKSTVWLCSCLCGNRIIRYKTALVSGKTKSCGCHESDGLSKRFTTHGQSRIPEYRSWISAIQRCENPRHIHFDRYGGRGIVMCEGWRNKFENFVESVGYKPSSKHSIDRIDNDGNYSCGKCPECTRRGWKMNCRWATPKEQANNRGGHG